jgi:hypothetical protein
MIGLFYLKQIENSPEGITTDELHSRLGNAGYQPPHKRTVQRDLEDFRKRGLKFTRKARRYSLKLDDNNLRVFLEFLREISLDSSYQKYFYGELSVRHGVNYFSGRPGTITLFYDSIQAIMQRHILNYDYTPQTDVTLLRMKVRSQFKRTQGSKIPVRMLPHFLVMAGESFMLLGEYYEKLSFNKGHFARPKERQYEFRGISDLSAAEVARPQLTIDPYQRYQNSLQIWVGGKEHDIVLEEVYFTGKPAVRKMRKVNGENEILSHVAASLGRLRVVNPPQELITRAEEIGLPQDLIFRYEK